MVFQSFPALRAVRVAWAGMKLGGEGLFLLGSWVLKFDNMFLNRTVIKKEEKIEKKEEKKPEDIKKEEKDQDELKPAPANRSRVTKSGD